MEGETNARLMGLAAAALLLPIQIAFGHYGHETRGFVVACVTIVFLGIIYTRRKRLQPHFLISVGALYAIQLLTALLIPLPDRLPGAAMIPISLADAFLMVGLLALIERFLGPVRGDKS